MSSMSRPLVQPLLRRALASSKILSAERERELLEQFHFGNDKAAMDELVRSHMPIIFRVASRSAQTPGTDINDLVQTATEGLLIAINRWSFAKSDASGARYNNELVMERSEAASQASSESDEEDPASATAMLPRASRLATYAMWWMRILLTDSVIEKRGLVVRAKNPKVRKALFNLPTAIKKLDINLPLTGHDVSRIAVYLEIGVKEIEEALVHAAGDVMLDEPIGDGSMVRGDTIADQRGEGEDGILNRLASLDRWGGTCEALMALLPRDRFILITRYLLTSKWKLDKLSKTLEMSRERIRQLADDGLTRIRRSVGKIHVSYDPARQQAIAAVEALVLAIERASESDDPEMMATLIRHQQIPIGPSRITSPRAPRTPTYVLAAVAA